MERGKAHIRDLIQEVCGCLVQASWESLTMDLEGPDWRKEALIHIKANLGHEVTYQPREDVEGALLLQVGR